MLSLKKISAILLTLCGAAAAYWPCTAPAGDTDQFAKLFDPGIELPDPGSNLKQHIRADKWKTSGKTMFLSGNVYMPYGNLILRADKVMIDSESRDIEAAGNITFSTVRRVKQTVTLEELERLMRQPDLLLEITGQSVDPLGQQKLEVMVSSSGSVVKADRLSGNLHSGLITFSNIEMQVNTFTCRADRGIRQPGGQIKLENAEFSSCEYLREDQSHISFVLKNADIFPHETNGFGFDNMEKDHTEYSIWGYNGTFRIYDVPILWLPLFYTPKDESPRLFQMQFGKSGDWGFYGLFSKKFELMSYPYVSATLDLDWYSLRGIGYGAHAAVATENSRTELSAYSIHDNRPYESSSDKPWHPDSDARLNIPDDRFDFRITNMTHLTPRLDFRGQVEWMSDAYMLDDYFSDLADAFSEPASYAALEYQADRYSASIYARFQVNDFFTTVQKLPEARLDLPRQEIIPGWNIYYQGSHTADYLRMSWAEFDRDLKNPLSKLEDYETGRFDSVNFLYYPLRTKYFNIVPRAGLRLTGYTNTSRVKLSEEDIFALQVAADPDDDYGVKVKNYDDDGASKLRVVAEFGVEANTKIYRTWQNVRSSFLGLDGLRHICEPYINYTFITDPNVDREKLLYFDDIDRLRELNFIRFGLRNRLQTRRGSFRDATIHEWFSMENYWDIYFNEDDYFNHIGDFCTKLSFRPTNELTFTGFMSIDAGNNQDHEIQSLRGDREAGRPGIGGTFFNRLYFGVQYRPIEDIVFNLSYDYKDGYIGRAAYSMGSTLTEIDSGSSFDQFYVTDRTQTLNFGVSAPLTPDRKTFGAYNISYDFEEGAFTKQSLAISRLFHCVRVSAMVELERDRDDDNDVEYETSFAVYATLVGLEEPIDYVRRRAVSEFTGLNGD
ncbi:MAG: LPS-assembly protein LptD [Lentisphaerae bacterium]|nr:LPS-assembly protein LptD [Lentisphaerota bacterium]